MKKQLLALGLLCSFVSINAQTFSDSFETYTVTTPLLGVQSPDWRTWSSTVGGGTEDVAVVNTDNHTAGGSQSVYFSSSSSTGGPTDCVLPFTSSTPLSTGQFTFTSWFKIPTGKSGYFNFQGTATLGAMYALDCYMTSTGSVRIENSGTPVLIGTHTFGAWFELSIVANFNTNRWELFINGVSQGTWANANNQVWGIDIYPPDATASYWMDDVSYNVAPYTLPALNAALNFVNVSNGLAGQTRNASITVRNLGTSVINSFSLAVSQNAGVPIMQGVSGLSLASLSSTVINIAPPFTLTTGSNVFTATVTNVNGLGADAEPTDDSNSNTITPITPAAGKIVVAEERTGTWCQWCPRGAVYMDAMNTKYTGFFAPIAVHNADPMTVAIYDSGIAPLASSFPKAVVDRLPAIDPSALETDILNRVIVAPKAVLKNGATYNSTTRVLNVSVTTTVQTAITGNYKLACVITEDDVTGTGSTYNQSNAYAGGGSGVMGGFEVLPNPVPAASMHYDHVARFISPSFAGLANAAGTSAAAGTVFTYTFTFTLPTTYDDTQINIVGLFIEPTGKIDNAGFAKMSQAITNGFVSGPGTGVGIFETAYAPDATIKVYPNPTTHNSSVLLNLDKPSIVSVTLYNVAGVLIATKNYGIINGNLNLPVDLENVNAGLYFVDINIDGKSSTYKLVKH